LKLLLLNVNRTGWHSGNMIYDMEVIKRACDTVIYGPGWDNYKNNDLREIIKQVYGDGKPDVIYSYFHENEKVGDVYMQHYKIPEQLRRFPVNMDLVNIPKIFAISDFWFQKDQNLIAKSGFQYCFGCFVPPYSRDKDFYSYFSEENRKNIKFVPHIRCVDEECFKDYGLPKKYDVITIGAMGHFYPFRSHMHTILSQNAKNLGINYKNYPHCGSNFNHSDLVRDKYAQTINSSKILVSCGGKYHLAMNKIFESMGCNTLYIGEKVYGEKELHLRSGWNYVCVNSTDFIDVIRHYLKNDFERNVIVKNAKDTFLKHHTINARARDFLKLLEGIL